MFQGPVIGCILSMVTIVATVSVKNEKQCAAKFLSQIHQDWNNSLLPPNQDLPHPMTANIATDHARNNSQGYRVDQTNTVVYRYSFFPRTTVDWNNLEQEIVSSKTLESFKTQISRCP